MDDNIEYLRLEALKLVVKMYGPKGAGYRDMVNHRDLLFVANEFFNFLIKGEVPNERTILS